MFLKQTLSRSMVSAVATAAAAGFCGTQALGAALVYESFSQDTSVSTALDGKAGGTGLNAWTANAGSVIAAEALSYGSLQHTGGQLEVTGNNKDAYVLTTSVLGDNGLLDDGKTLWFSFMYSKSSQNGNNEKGGFAFGSERIDGAFNGTNMTNNGDAIGAFISGTTLAAGSWSGNGNVDTGTGTSIAVDTSYFVVGKIEWGATALDDETITLYLQDTSNLGTLSSAIGTQTMAGVNQTAFDTISVTTHQSQGTITYDEIRFGATFEDVTPVPEPGSLALMGLGALCVLRRRRN